MLGYYFLSWAFTLLLAVLMKQTAMACTLSTPSLAEGIFNDQQFKTSVANCTVTITIAMDYRMDISLKTSPPRLCWSCWFP